MRCANCGSENADGTKFCRDCGTTLAQRCPRCAAPNPPGSRFCGECGVRLAEAPVGNAKTSRGVNAGHSEHAADATDIGRGAETGRTGGRSANAGSADASGDGDATGLAYAADLRVAENLRVGGETRVIIDARHEATVNPPEGERKTVTALFADIKGSTELMEDLDPEEARALIDPALQLMIEAVRRYGCRPVSRLTPPNCAPKGACQSRFASGSTAARWWFARFRLVNAPPNTHQSDTPRTWLHGFRQLRRQGRSS